MLEKSKHGKMKHLLVKLIFLLVAPCSEHKKVIELYYYDHSLPFADWLNEKMAKTVLGEPGSLGPQGGLIRMYIEVRTGGPKEESLFSKKNLNTTL